MNSKPFIKQKEKKLLSLFMLLFVFSLFMPASLLAIDSGQIYRLVSKSTNQALEILNASTSEGAPAVLREQSDRDSQRWMIQCVNPEAYVFTAVHSGFALTLAGPSQNDGIPLLQYNYQGGLEQEWRLEALDNGYYKIVSKATGKCMEVPSRNNNVLQQGTWEDMDNQKWKIAFATEPPLSHYTFESGAEEWSSKNLHQQPYTSSLWSASGNCSLQTDLDQDIEKSFRVCLEKNLDLTGALRLSAVLRQEDKNISPEGMRAQLYVMTGMTWNWNSTAYVPLTPGIDGIELIMDLSGIDGLEFTREIGINFFTENGSSGSTSVFVDDVFIEQENTGISGNILNTYNGYMYEDTAGNKYMLEIEYEYPTILHKLDPAGESFLWNYTVPSDYATLYFDDENRLYVSTGSDLISMDASTGKVKSYNYSTGIPVGETDDYIILTYYAGKNLSVISKDTGKILWQKTFSLAPRITLQEDIIYVKLQAPYNSGDPSSVLAFETATGTMKWSTDVIVNNLSIDTRNTQEAGVLYLTGIYFYAKIDKDTGNVLWVSHAGWTSFLSYRIGDDLYFRRSNELVKLDPDTGQEIWIYTAPAYMTLNLFEDEIFVLYTDTSPEENTALVKLNKNTGMEEWTAQSPDKNASLTYLDHNILLVEKTGISKLNNNDGSVSWAQTTIGKGRIYTDSAQSLILLKDENRVSSLDPETGTTLWSRSFTNPLNVEIDEQDRIFLSANGSQGFDFLLMETSGLELFSWSKTGEEFKGYSVSENTLYLLSSERILAADPGNGLLWETSFPANYNYMKHLKSTDREKLYFYNYNNGLYDSEGEILCLDRATGHLNWQIFIDGTDSSAVNTDTVVYIPTLHYSGDRTIYVIGR